MKNYILAILFFFIGAIPAFSVTTKKEYGGNTDTHTSIPATKTELTAVLREADTFLEKNFLTHNEEKLTFGKKSRKPSVYLTEQCFNNNSKAHMNVTWIQLRSA